MNFKETVVSLAEYFAEVKSLKEAGIDIVKLDAHKKLYDIVLQQMIAFYGFHETAAIVKNAFDGKMSDHDLDVLTDLIFPTTEPAETEQMGEQNVEDSSYEAPQVSETSPKYFINGKEVTAEEFDTMTKKFEDGFNIRFTNDWLLRTLLG